MSSVRRLATATLSYGLSTYVPRLVNFALLPVYAAYLSPEQMGILEVLTAVDALLAAVTRLGLPGALSRDYFDNRAPEQFRDLITTVAAALAASCLVFSALAAWLGPYLFAAFVPEIPFHPYVDLVLITALFRAAPELQARLLQAREQAVLAAQLNVGMSLFGTLARVVLVVGLEWSVLGALWAELATSVLGLGIALVRHRQDLRGRVRPQLLRSALAYGLPLVPHHLGAWLSEFGGRGVMGGLGVLAAVGQLGVAARLVSPVQVAASAFATAFGPVYFGWRTDLDTATAVREVRKTSAVVLGIGTVLALGVATGGTVVLRWFLPEAYHAASGALGVLAAGLLVRIMYNVLGMELLYAKRTGAISLIFVVGSVVTIGLTTALVGPYGVVGAACAQALGTTTSVALSGALARRTFPLAIAPRAAGAVVVAGLLAAAAPALMPGTSLLLDVGVGLGVFAASALLALALAGTSPSAVRDYLRARRKGKKKAAHAASKVVRAPEDTP